MNPQDIPAVMVASYNWAVENGVFNGSIDDYVELQYLQYCIACAGYSSDPLTMKQWMDYYKAPSKRQEK